MKTLLKSLFLGLVALVTTSSVISQTTCYSENAEGTPRTPSTWTFKGLPENLISPISGTADWKSSGFKTGLEYYIQTPWLCHAIFNSDDFASKNITFDYAVQFGSSNTITPLKCKISVLYAGYSPIVIYDSTLRTGNGTGSFDYSSLKPSPAISTPNQSNWALRIEFYTTNSITNNAYYVKVDNVNLGCWLNCIVTGNNISPVSNAGSDASTTVGTSVNLNGSGSYDPGPSGDAIVSYLWYVSSGDNSQVSFSNTNTASPSVTFAAAGTYTLTLEVTDGNGGVDYDDVVITVSAASQAAAISNDGSSDVTIWKGSVSHFLQAGSGELNFSDLTVGSTWYAQISATTTITFMDVNGDSISNVVLNSSGNFTIPTGTVFIQVIN